MFPSTTRLISVWLILLSSFSSQRLLAQKVFLAGGKGGLYEMDLSTCDVRLITKTIAFTDIAYHKESGKLFGLSGYYLCEVDLKTGDTTNLLKGPGGNAMELEEDYLLVAKGNELLRYDIKNDNVISLGTHNYYSAGDLSFVGNNLYLSVDNRRVVKFQRDSKGFLQNSTVVDSIGSLSSDIYGLVTTGCRDLILFSEKRMFRLDPEKPDTEIEICPGILTESVLGAALKEDIVETTDWLGQDTFLCPGDTISYFLPAEAEYTWNNGSTDSTFAVTKAGTYWVNISFGKCEISDTLKVDETQTPTIDLGPDTTLCANATLLLDAYWPGAQYSWKGDHSTSTFLVKEPGTYWARTYTTACGESSDTLVIDYFDHTPPNLGNDTFFCQGTGVALKANTSNGPLTWSNLSNNESYYVETPDTYWVNLEIGHCFYSDTIIVRERDTPIVDLGPDTLLCQSKIFVLNSSWPNSQYLWSNGSTRSRLYPDSTGTYWLKVTSKHCGSASDTIHLEMLDIELDLGKDTVLCPNEKLTLRSNVNNLALLWSNNATSQSILVAKPDIIWLKASKEHCEYFDTIRVDYFPGTDVSLGDDTVHCGNSLTLKPSLDVPRPLWSNGSTQESLLVEETGTYWLESTTEKCGSVRDTIHVTIEPNKANWLGSDTTICADRNIELSIPFEFRNALWSTGEETGKVKTTDSAMYKVTVTTKNGCEHSDSVLISKVDCSCPVFISNAFSPNNDGINDGFKPIHGCHFKNYQFSIYNRWGQCVFRTLNQEDAWPGPSPKQDLSPGVFVYHVYYELYSGREVFLSGNVSTAK